MFSTSSPLNLLSVRLDTSDKKFVIDILTSLIFSSDLFWESILLTIVILSLNFIPRHFLKFHGYNEHQELRL